MGGTVMYFSGAIIQANDIASDNETNVWLAAFVSFFNFLLTLVGLVSMYTCIYVCNISLGASKMHLYSPYRRTLQK